MKYLNFVITSTILIFLMSCSTPYQPKGMLGGYSEEKILTNMYKVEFKGNQHTKPDLIQKYLLYRCAELTKENGFEYFTVVSEERHFDEFVSRQESVQPWTKSGSMSGGLKVYANPDLQNPTSSTNYTGVYFIKFLKEINEKYKNAVFNVDEVMEELGEIVL